MRFRLCILVFFIAIGSFATHNRAGYISYKRIGTTGYKYHFTIYTYTNPSSVGADRCTETLVIMNLGGGGADTINCTRTNFTAGVDLYPSQLAGCGSDYYTPGQSGQGLMLVYPYDNTCGGSDQNYGGVKVNTYEGDYEFSGVPNGYFAVGMLDPNLDSQIQNISGSSNVAFALVDTISISQYANYNNTPLVSNPPIDNACAGKPFFYNPGMNDQDGDSLVYSLLPSFLTGSSSNGNSGGSGSTFFYTPFSTSYSNLTVDNTGTISWLNAPGTTGEYEIDMLVKEYRRVGSQMFEVGTEVFAIQIYVQCCSSVMTITPTSVKNCIEAGQPYNSPSISANESPNLSGTNLNMTASGTPLISPNTGTFTITGTSVNNVTGVFNWTPSCFDVKLNPYFVIVRAFDSNTPVNANYSSISLQVVSPPVLNLTTVPQGQDSIKLTWSPPSCGTNTTNVIVDYLIYRANNCVSYSVSPCKTGVPALPPGVPPSSWYQPIGSTSSLVFYDDNNGQGLAAGSSYSYIVIAQYADGSLSMAPNNLGSNCVTLHLGIPILTNVSVDTTDTHAGAVFVRWHKPLIGGLDLDTSSGGHPGPYYFVLQRKAVNPPSSAGTYTTIYTTSPKFFSQLNSLADTTFTDNLAINTQDNQFYYKVLFYGNNHYIGSGTQASSVYAKGVGHDKKVFLSWASNTPWTNTTYYVYQQNSANLGYTLVGTTTHTGDTLTGLTNKHTYCFRIMALGSYFNSNIVSPDTNWSQKICVAPIDDSPPCQPPLTVVGNCDESINKLTWRNANHACNINDVLKYYIYYTPRKDSTLTKIDSTVNANDTTYTTDYNAANIAGCYVIVAVDSAGNKSPLANETCTDDCPEYVLPNIFTPNGDNVNDFYIPVKNRYVRSVDFVLYNRWGEVIYENTNPALGWDGKSKQMKQPVPDGVYFYTCTVNEIHYYGLQSVKLKGFVQVLK